MYSKEMDSVIRKMKKVDLCICMDIIAYGRHLFSSAYRNVNPELLGFWAKNTAKIGPNIKPAYSISSISI